MKTSMTRLNVLPEGFQPYAAFGHGKTGNLFPVEMRDDGMEGTLRCGEWLLVESYNHAGNYWWDGIYYYELGGHRLVRRLQRVADGVLVKADNKKVPDVKFSETNLAKFNFKILGMVRFHVAQLC